MKMQTLHVMWTWIFLSGLRNSATVGADVYRYSGYSGKAVTIKCYHDWASTNIKYFCRDPCKDVLVKSNQSPKGRYTLKDHRDGTFTVSITNLQESDSGVYWCAVERWGKDTFQEVNLKVSKDPSRNIRTFTQPYKVTQTFMEVHTTTPSASPSIYHSKPITLSSSVPVNTTVYTLYAVGGLLIAVIILGAGLFAVHQHRKRVKASAGITLANKSKAEQDERDENDTMTRQKQIYSVYSNVPSEHALYGNL